MNQEIAQKSVYVFEDIIKEIEHSGISSVCRTINKFNKIMNEDNLSSKNKDLENLIREDISLTNAILKTANSPIYRGINKQGIDDISNAIRIIGWFSIYKIGMSLTVKNLIKTSKAKTFANWMISRTVTVAQVSEIFLDSIKLFNNKLNGIDSVYAYGLLHDIGALALLQTVEHYQQDVMGIKLQLQNKNWSEAENILYGFDHNMVGERILMRSQLPINFAIVARYHHSPNPLKYTESASKIITLIRLAQASLIDINKFSGHCSFTDFNSIPNGVDLIREYKDFSEY
jgi:HD-like signal output (HDOD) protein